MKKKLKNIKLYFVEFTIVTAGVLLALFLNNLKESNQAREYHSRSIVAVHSEIKENYDRLRGVVEKQKQLLDTIQKYSTSDITLSDLILEKGGGLKVAFVNNIGLEFYKKNQLDLVDFEVMSKLINMEKSAKLIDVKTAKLLDFLYPNFFVNSEESKKSVILQLHNLLNTELYLIHEYSRFIDEYIEEKELKANL